MIPEPSKQLAATSFTRCAIGLGNPSAIENSGATLHHIYGFPILPGSALKGGCRHYLNEFGIDQPFDDLGIETIEELAELLFGAPPQKDKQQYSAVVEFFDGWPAIGNSDWFDVDVITPHSKPSSKLPLDSDGPTPLYFLTIAPKVTFDVYYSITRRGRHLTDSQIDLVFKLVREILTRALDDWGVGARTKYGLGRFRCKEME